MRRGMKRPASIISHAGTFTASGDASATVRF